MAAVGTPLRTLQEWLGHRDLATTQRYADYAPSAHEAAFVAAAFGGGRTPGGEAEARKESVGLTTECATHSVVP